jgi:hypothetical protein
MPMEIVEWIGFGVILLLCALGLLFARREIIARNGGTIEVSFRLSTLVPGRGWSPGIARFTGDDLRWYRVFSFALRPSRTLSRRGLVVDGRRSPEAAERLALPGDWVILHCTGQQAPVEIAMARTTLTGFMSWIESGPPGGASIRFAAS